MGVHRHAAKMAVGLLRQPCSQCSNNLAVFGNRDVNAHRAEPIVERLQIGNRVSERVDGILVAILIESREQACEYTAGIVRLRSANAKTLLAS